MGAFENAMTKRALSTVRTELQFLAEANVITNTQLETILLQLPADETTQSRQTTPAAAPRQQQQRESLTSQMNNMSMNNSTAHDEKKSSNYYNDSTPANHNAPPPAYPTAPPVPSALCYATALYQYNAQDAGDLQLAPNDKIAVTEYMNGEWWKGKNTTTGQEGIFPRSYVKVEEKGAGAGVGYEKNMGHMSHNPPVETGEGSASGGMASRMPGGDGKGSEMGKKFGKKLGNAAIFGAGATVGSKIVNGIF